MQIDVDMPIDVCFELSRPIDDLSWSLAGENTYSRGGKQRMKVKSVNGHCSIPEKLKHDHIDDLAEAMRILVDMTGTYFIGVGIVFVIV